MHRRRSTVLSAALITVGLVACGQADSDEVEASPAGSIVEGGVSGVAPAAENGIAAVVTLTPKGDTGQNGTALAEPLIDQFGLSFSPGRLLVAPGTLEFTNSEASLIHNVRLHWLDRDSTVFDGDAVPGDRLEVAVPGAGGYDVLCEMHPGMSAFVFASDAPYATFASDDGAFDLGRPPAGEYVARVWTRGGSFGPPVDVTVAAGGTELDLRSSG